MPALCLKQGSNPCGWCNIKNYGKLLPNSIENIYLHIYLLSPIRKVCSGPFFFENIIGNASIQYELLNKYK